MFPFSMFFVTTTCIPAIAAERICPCADDGSKLYFYDDHRVIGMHE
jgi:hypothetical protein